MNSTARSIEETLWSRHSNPKSGWTRVPIGPLIVYAVYRRDFRLLTAALVWTILNPVVFSPPETDKAWMTRAVLAERWWVREQRNGTIGRSYPNVCNAGGAIAFAYALVAAWVCRPIGAAVGSIVASALKLWWIAVIVRRYDATREDDPDRLSSQ